MDICTDETSHVCSSYLYDISVQQKVRPVSAAAALLQYRTMSDEESSDEDYDFHGTTNDLHGDDMEARYPIHDCCEYEDVDALKVRMDIILRCVLQRPQSTMVCASVRQT